MKRIIYKFVKLLRLNRLLSKFFISLVGVSLVIIIITETIIYLTTVTIRDRTLKNNLNIVSELFINTYTTSYGHSRNEKEAFEFTIRIIDKLKLVRLIRILDERKQSIRSYPEGDETLLQNTKDNSIEDNFYILTERDRRYAKIVKSINIQGNKKYFIEIITPVDDIFQIFSTVLLKTGIILFFIILLTLPLFYMFSKKLLKPIHQLSLEIKKVKESLPSSWRQISQLKDNDFLNEIIISVNELIFRSQRSLVCQENIGRFLSHEIKTPLTNLINEIETEQPKLTKVFFDQLINDILRINSIVNNICEMAYTDIKSQHNIDIDIIELIKTTITEFEHIYRSKVCFECLLSSYPACIQTSPNYFWILASNILRNSFEHGNGHIWPPTIRLTDRDGHYLVEFSDHGTGFPEIERLNPEITNEKSAMKLLKTHGSGLILCLKLSEMLNFEIKFENKSPYGALVSLKIKKI